MTLLVLSMFRNAFERRFTDRFLAQMLALKAALEAQGDHLTCTFAWGDSTDLTGSWAAKVAEQLGDVRLVHVSHGGKDYGSVESADRLRQLSIVGNALIAASPAPRLDGVAMYVEADLIWTPGAVLNLTCLVDEGRADAVSPMIFGPTGKFYDTWIYRRGGRRFTPHPPYHPDLRPGELLPVESSGSMVVYNPHVQAQCRWAGDEAILGFTKDIVAKGFSLVVDPTVEIHHP